MSQKFDEMIVFGDCVACQCRIIRLTSIERHLMTDPFVGLCLRTKKNPKCYRRDKVGGRVDDGGFDGGPAMLKSLVEAPEHQHVEGDEKEDEDAAADEFELEQESEMR